MGWKARSHTGQHVLGAACSTVPQSISQPPYVTQSVSTISPGSAPAWRHGAAASGGFPASVFASGPAAPSVLAGCPPGGRPPPLASRQPAQHAAPAALLPTSARTPSALVWHP